MKTEASVSVTLTGRYTPEERSNGYPDGVDDFKVMLGEMDVTLELCESEYSELYQTYLDELRTLRKVS